MNFKILRTCDRGFGCHACGRQNSQLNTYDWLSDVPGNAESTDLVEVQFKNTRKGYYHNVNGLDLKKGDVVAVEANPGHDIGVVTLTGRLVKLQIKKANLKSPDEIRRIYRIAKETDMDKFREAKSREHGTMIQSRQIAKDLGLKMKIGDVEYQGDGNKAIFYYIADERVDFRQLIKVLAETFHVRIEMKQIGARQEAGRIGGTGPCGRELCCATWMKNFVSVSTNAARIQDISLNPQKLAGMCAKLKCCLNYEVDDYMEASRRLPDTRCRLLLFQGRHPVGSCHLLHRQEHRCQPCRHYCRTGTGSDRTQQEGRKTLVAQGRRRRDRREEKRRPSCRRRRQPIRQGQAQQEKEVQAERTGNTSQSNNPQKPNAQKAGPAPANDPKANQTSDNAQGTDDRGARGNQRRGNNRKPRRQQPRNDRAPRQQNNPDNNRRQNDQPQ